MNNNALLEVINYLQKDSHREFLTYWLISLGLVVIIAVIFHQTESHSSKHVILAENQNKNININSEKNFLFYFQITCFFIFLGIYIYLILNKADFAYHDNDQFTLFSLQGKFFKMPIWGRIGRYWPLGLQEYNIISIFSKTPLAYHSFSIFQLVVVIFICLFILPQLKLSYKFIFTTLILILPSFVISFFGLIFPERNIIFWLAIFIFCLERLKTNNSLKNICILFVSVQFLLYYKEPMFLLISGFAGSRLIIFAIEQKLWHQLSQKIFQFLQENWLDFGLLIQSLLFIYLYISTVQDEVKTSYVNIIGVDHTPFVTLIIYLKADTILIIFFLVFVGRILGLIIRKYRFDLIWDALAIGNCLYFLAYIKLNLFRWYYTAPVDFIAILYLANIYSLLFVAHNKNKLKNFAVLALVTLICLKNFSHSSYAILSRKKEIASTVTTTNYLSEYIRIDNQKPNKRLFFPRNKGYYIMQFHSFLKYKNFVEKNLFVITKKKFKNNQCISFRPLKCFYRSKPEPDDLIIFLSQSYMIDTPNLSKSTYISQNTLKEYKNNSVELFHYQPKFQGIEKILYFFCRDLIDDEWMNAYILTGFRGRSSEAVIGGNMTLKP